MQSPAQSPAICDRPTQQCHLIHYGEAGQGGHFAVLEQPEILVSEIRTGLRTLRAR